MSLWAGIGRGATFPGACAQLTFRSCSAGCADEMFVDYGTRLGNGSGGPWKRASSTVRGCTVRPRRRHRRLFWPVGLTSLAIVPLAFVHHLATDPATHPQYGMELRLAPRDFDGRPAKVLNWDYDMPPGGQWEPFEFTDNDADNSLQFNRLRQYARGFVARRDTEKGILIRLGPRMAYETFVRVVDMLCMEGALHSDGIGRYSLYDSAIWVYRFPRYDEPQLRASPFPGDPLPNYLLGRAKRLDPQRSFVTQCRRYWQDELRHLPIPVLAILLASFAVNVHQARRCRESGRWDRARAAGTNDWGLYRTHPI